MVVINMLSAAASMTAAESRSIFEPSFGNELPLFSRLAVPLADAWDAVCGLLPRQIAEAIVLLRRSEQELAGVIGLSLQDVLNVP